MKGAQAGPRRTVVSTIRVGGATNDRGGSPRTVVGTGGGGHATHGGEYDIMLGHPRSVVPLAPARLPQHSIA